MPISTVITDFRFDNACDIAQLPDTVALRYYNDCRDILVDAIVKEKEDYFYNELLTDIVTGQREYSLPKRGTVDGLATIKSVAVKYKTTDTDFAKLTPRSVENVPEDLLSYDTSSNPFYVVSDTSVFLYPTPTESVTAGLLIYGVLIPKKLILTDEETLPDNHQKCILLGMAERWFTSQLLYDKATYAGNKFREETARVCTALSGRIQSPIQRTVPNLNYLT